MLKSFDEAINYISENYLLKEYTTRIEKIVDESSNQKWFNRELFDRTFNSINENQ